MCGLKRLKTIITAMFIAVLSACGEEDEQTVPLPQGVTAARLDSCLGRKGWTHVSSYEVKPNGTLDRTDYYTLPDAGSPSQYYFNGDTITTFLSTEANTVEGYERARYTYNPATHRLKTADGEVFKLLTVSPTELCVLKYQGFNGNGMPIYICSTYRVMNAGEIVSCRRSHPYNLVTINKDYPVLPEQMLITPASFRQNAANSGWKCVEAHRMETANRYSAADIQALDGSFAAGNLYFTADSIIAFELGVFSGFKVRERQKYSFRANSFSLYTGSGAALRVLSLTADEMRLLLPSASEAGEKGCGLYCIYRKMTAEELASAVRKASFKTAADS